MSFFGFGPNNTVLGRLQSLANDVPGAVRWVQNKDTDQSGHTDTENVDGTGHWEIRCYNGTGGALVVGDCYHFTYGGDEETNPKVIAWTDADNNNDRLLVVAVEAAADATFCWVAFAGYVDIAVEGTTDVAKGDYLMLDTNAASGLTDLITSGGTVETNSTVAIACEAATAAGSNIIRCFLLGKEKICDQQ